MHEDFIKTGIKALIAEKTISSNMLIVSSGATIGLIIKALSQHSSLIETLFIFIGILFVVFTLKRIDYYSQKIRFLLFELKKEK